MQAADQELIWELNKFGILKFCHYSHVVATTITIRQIKPCSHRFNYRLAAGDHEFEIKDGERNRNGEGKSDIRRIEGERVKGENLVEMKGIGSHGRQ
ncbi:hypothetical protein SLE2022_057870 [Rubroshorea leprosula]